MVVTREPMGKASLYAFSTFMLSRSAGWLKGYELLESVEAEVGGRPSVHVRCTFETESGPAELLIVYVGPGAQDAERYATVFMLTSEGGVHREAFEALLRTVRFDGASEVTEPAAEPRARL